MRGYGDNSGALKEYEGEVLLLGYGWNPDKGHWITLALDVADTEGHPFSGFKRGLERGQRFRMTFTPILDNEETVEQPKAEKERRRFEDMPASQQAGMLCAEPAFQKWLFCNRTLQPQPDMTAEQIRDHAARAVRHLCGVKSRSELDTNPSALIEWRELLRDYRVATGKEPWRP